MIAKIIMFLADLIINLKYFIDELSVFLSSITQWPHIAYRTFQVFYRDYQEIIFSIIIIGGLTRLTNSGLSITELELFSGIFPPLNESSWIDYFNQYKKIPQYKLLNFDMSLNEFKVIFYWEYVHRIFA